MRNFFLCLVLTFGSVATAFGATLTWDSNTDADLAGYNAYRATGTCTNPANFVKQNTTMLPKTANAGWVDSPTQDGDYCWVVTALDLGGLESLFSNKAGLTVNVNPPLAPKNLAVK